MDGHCSAKGYASPRLASRPLRIPSGHRVDHFYLGRTLHACQIAFEEMRKGLSQHSGPVRPYHPTTSYVNIAPAVASRPLSEPDPLLAARRPLQPRPPQIRTTESPNPPVTNGGSPVYSRSSLLDPVPEPTRKRGRPTKAEAAERDKAYAERGQTYQPKRRSIKRMRPSIGPEAPELKDEEVTTPLPQTPNTRILTPVGETSSGKRKSRRQPNVSPIQIPSGSAEPPRQESEQGQQQEQGQEHEPEANVARSPSDRLLASHRDRGSVGSSLSRRTQQESDSLEQGHFESEFPT